MAQGAVAGLPLRRRYREGGRGEELEREGMTCGAQCHVSKKTTYKTSQGVIYPVFKS